MSYRAILNLTKRKEAVWLYEITLRGTVYRYTSAGAAFIWGGNSWSSMAISHGRITHSPDVNRLAVDVQIPASHTLADEFRGRKGVVDAKLRILHGFRGDPAAEFIVKYVGWFGTSTDSDGGGVTTLRFENLLSLFRQAVDNEVIQQPCRHVLYSGNCGVTQASFTTTLTVSDITGSTLTIDASPLPDDDYYSGGILTYGSDTRWIIRNASDQFLIESVPTAMQAYFDANGTVDADFSAGCPLSRTVCNDRFSNILNYGGFDFISDNPFERNVF